MTSALLRRLGGLLLPLLLLALLAVSLRGPIVAWLRGDELYDEESIREWIREARVESAGLPELVRAYLDLASREEELKHEVDAAGESTRFALVGELDQQRQRLDLKREEIQEFFKALCSPPTKLYRGQLPLFPVVYRIAVRFAPEQHLTSIAWDSELPREASQYRELKGDPVHKGALVDVEYSLHAYHQVQTKERQETLRRLLLGGLGALVTLLATYWVYLLQRRQRRQEHQRLLAEQQANEAERRRLEEALRRQEAERKHAEAERQNLELKSQLFANIGIMAGSYAHNIKNLLVRPNDLLRRCIEGQGGGEDQPRMLREVQETLGTVTERLQQILQTVRRDPNRSETVRLDLNALVGDMHRTWGELAREKWKMTLTFEPAIDASGVLAPLPIDGDLSHLQQAFENLLFNARDATFEMRNNLREQARKEDADKRQALLTASGWRGQVVLRTRRDAGHAVLEVTDNGIGMSDEVRAQCTETHFSTKRNNALFAGLSAGMGLGLSFVTVILAHHRAALEIESQPKQGAMFRIRFPIAGLAHPPGGGPTL